MRVFAAHFAREADGAVASDYPLLLLHAQLAITANGEDDRSEAQTLGDGLAALLGEEKFSYTGTASTSTYSSTSECKTARRAHGRTARHATKLRHNAAHNVVRPTANLFDVFGSIYSWLASLCCAVTCTTSTIKVNERSLKVVKLLAEGGFSFVYLVEEKGSKYALKKVLAQLEEQSALAKWEIEVHKAFKHKNLMPLLDSCAAPTANGAEEFRLLMPLYPNGTLLDRCIQLMEAKERMPEKEALTISAQILQGVRQFHEHSPPWAHRDIKPANVLLGDDDTPVLMDFGSATTARRKISTRTEALLLQEDAAQNCSMPYRAPELFDVPSDATIDERTDIFSLGATLYAMGFYYSPFECTYQDATQRVVECSYSASSAARSSRRTRRLPGRADRDDQLDAHRRPAQAPLRRRRPRKMRPVGRRGWRVRGGDRTAAIPRVAIATRRSRFEPRRRHTRRTRTPMDFLKKGGDFSRPRGRPTPASR